MIVRRNRRLLGCESLKAALAFGFVRVVQGELELVESSLFSFLFADVFPNRFGIPPDGIDELTSLPQSLPSVVPPFLQEVPRHVDRALSLDVSHHARHCELRWDADQQVDMDGMMCPSLIRQPFYAASR